VVAPFMEIFGLSRSVALSTVLFLSAVVYLLCFGSSIPRRHHITMTSGGPGTSFETNAMKYARFWRAMA